MAGPTVVATISANDQATATLKAIAAVAKKTAQEMEGMGRDTGMVRNLEAGTVAANRQAAAIGRIHAGIKQAASAAKEMVGNLAMLAGPIILHAVVKGVESGAELQSQNVKNEIAGIPLAEREAAAAQAAELAAKYHNLDTASLIELYRETRSVMQDTREVPGIMPIVAQAKSAMDAADPSGKGSEGLVYALKGAELLGLAKSPELFRNYIDSFLKAQEVLGKTINPEQVYEFAKYSKASGARFSPEFVNTIGPLLSQEMGGSTAGTSLAQFEKMMQTANNHTAAKEFVAMGLANRDDFEKTKTGEIKGLKVGHKLKDADLAASNPAQYVWGTLIPALKAHGFDTIDKQVAEAGRLFQNTNSASVVAKLIQQQSTFAAHMVRINQAMGLAATNLERDDAKVALGTVTTGLENLAATLTNPFMGDAAHGLATIADGLSTATLALSHWSEAYPTAARAVGALATAAGLGGGALLSWKLMMGFLGRNGVALNGSALALDGSAAALDRAALALMGAAGKGVVPGEGVVPGKEGVPNKEEAPNKGGALGEPLPAPKGPSIDTPGLKTAGAFLGLNSIIAMLNGDDPGTVEGRKSIRARDKWFDDFMKPLLPEGWVTPIKDDTVGPQMPDFKKYPDGIAAAEHDKLARNYKLWGMQNGRGPVMARPDLSGPSMSSYPDLSPQEVERKRPAPFVDFDKAYRWQDRDPLGTRGDPEAAHGRAYHELLGNLQPRQPDRPIEVAPIKGTVSGEATILLKIDASGVSNTSQRLNLSGQLGKSGTVPSGRDDGHGQH